MADTKKKTAAPVVRSTVIPAQPGPTVTYTKGDPMPWRILPSEERHATAHAVLTQLSDDFYDSEDLPDAVTLRVLALCVKP